MKTEVIPDFLARSKRIEQLRPMLLSLAKTRQTPLYVFDRSELIANLSMFRNAFAEAGVMPKIFYALKSNHYQGLACEVVKNGGSLDVSSVRELRIAENAGSPAIVYTGPAKSEADFEQLLCYPGSVTVQLESEREVLLANRVALKAGKVLRCGVRVHSQLQAKWIKFGIPLGQLVSFLRKSSRLPGVKLAGIHFHSSHNRTPDLYVRTLQEICRYAKEKLSKIQRQKLEFIDIGGGIFPSSFEAYYAWNAAQVIGSSSEPAHRRALAGSLQKCRPAPQTAAISRFAESIAKVWREEVLPLCPNVELYTEPGRAICHSTMHLLLSVVEKRGTRIALLDGGGNMVGWEKYQYLRYVPIFNLSRFSRTKELPAILYGSLCTPEDVWGYSVFGQSLREGDLLVVPYQGAYVFSLAQNFIREIPQVVEMKLSC